MMTIPHILILTICLYYVAAKPSSNENKIHLLPLIINNSGSENNNNAVNNGNDSLNGNLINGNNNGDNINSGKLPINNPVQFIINNSGNNNSKNEISNGNDDVNGNLINGNGNGNNSNSGNVENYKRPLMSIGPLIINNSGNDNKNNSLQNGNDNVNGNLVNGNDNGDNSNSGNINSEKDNNRLQAITADVTLSELSSESSSESSSSESNDELLQRIDTLLELILQRLNKIRIIANVRGLVDILLMRVREILINNLRNLRNISHNNKQNNNELVEVSNLIHKLDTVERLCRDKLIKLPEMINSLNRAIKTRNNNELSLIPTLLQQIHQLLRVFI